MPELPEVEIVTRNLQQILQPPVRVLKWMFFRKDLRFTIPQKELKKLINQTVLKIDRRAKYILIEFEKDVIIAHLGMTGSWRSEPAGWTRRKHDHLAFEYQTDLFLVYEDPRRFGFVEVCAKKDLQKRFQGVGVEPLDPDFKIEEITKSFKKLKAPVKTTLMNQKFVVGIGNIYASEILFRAKVSPLKQASAVTKAQYDVIWMWSLKILNEAIKMGGSTIENYKNSFGQKGNYQNRFYVYNRKNEACLICKTPIKSKILAGRSTFWCPTCQK